MTAIKDSKLDFLQRDIYTGIVKPEGYTTNQLNSLTNIQEGWLAQDTDKNALVRYDGTDWISIASNTTSPSPFDALVGPNQDYTTLKEAVDDGRTRIAIVESTSETADINLTNYMYNIYLFDKLDMNKFNIDCTNVNYLNFIGSNRGAFLECDYNTNKEFLVNTSSMLSLQISNLSIQHEVTSVISPFPALNYDFTIQMDNVLFLNYSLGETAYLNLKNSGTMATNLYLQGGRDLHGKILNVSTGAIVSGFCYTGNGKQTDGSTNLIEVIDASLSNGSIAGDGTLRRLLKFDAHSLVTNIKIKTENDAPYDILINGVKCILSDIYGNKGILYVNSNDDCSFTNLQNFGNANEITITGNFNSFINSQFDIIFNVEGNTNRFICCKFSPLDSVGGNSTVKVKLGATGNIITNNFVDVSITDDGSLTQLAHNLVI